MTTPEFIYRCTPRPNRNYFWCKCVSAPINIFIELSVVFKNRAIENTKRTVTVMVMINKVNVLWIQYIILPSNRYVIESATGSSIRCHVGRDISIDFTPISQINTKQHSNKIIIFKWNCINHLVNHMNWKINVSNQFSIFISFFLLYSF